METTNREIEALKKLLDQCRLAAPVPEEHKKHIRKNRRKSFIALTKLTGKYSLWENALSYVFFGCTRFGLQLTALQSGVILVIGSIVTAAGISTGGYFVAKKIFLAVPEEKPVQVEQVVNVAPVKPVIPVKAKPRPKPFTLNLNIDGYGNIDKKTTAKITKKVKLHFAKNGITIDKKYIVAGEVSAVEGNYYAKIRAFSNEVKQVHFKRNKFKNVDDLQGFFIKESRKIAEKVK
ncbi:MAG: hypothetical protein GY754_12920 [bacterium]|nr:hypothetical protein [bacterium]